MWKPYDAFLQRFIIGFSPLAGIRYAETYDEDKYFIGFKSFSPLAGIRYAETSNQCFSVAVLVMFQSPCGD